MNKELEALQKLRDLVEYLTRVDYVPTDLRNEVKTLLINSYEDSNGYFSQIEKALKRNEPMKRIKHKIKDRAYPELLCPICFLQNHPLNHYCPYCGQRLDWGSEK